MTAFLALGMSLDDVIQAVTSAPAAVLGKGERLGTLRPGAIGDAAVLELRVSERILDDGYGNLLSAERELIPVMTVLDGKVREELMPHR
jgi:dihydroorotase